MDNEQIMMMAIFASEYDTSLGKQILELIIPTNDTEEQAVLRVIHHRKFISNTEIIQHFNTSRLFNDYENKTSRINFLLCKLVDKQLISRSVMESTPFYKVITKNTPLVSYAHNDVIEVNTHTMHHHNYRIGTYIGSIAYIMERIPKNIGVVVSCNNLDKLRTSVSKINSDLGLTINVVKLPLKPNYARLNNGV